MSLEAGVHEQINAQVLRAAGHGPPAELFELVRHRSDSSVAPVLCCRHTHLVDPAIRKTSRTAGSRFARQRTIALRVVWR